MYCLRGSSLFVRVALLCFQRGEATSSINTPGVEGVGGWVLLTFPGWDAK